jgi:hypothetical protein
MQAYITELQDGESERGGRIREATDGRAIVDATATYGVLKDTRERLEELALNFCLEDVFTAPVQVFRNQIGLVEYTVDYAKEEENRRGKEMDTPREAPMPRMPGKEREGRRKDTDGATDATTCKGIRTLRPSSQRHADAMEMTTQVKSTEITHQVRNTPAQDDGATTVQVHTTSVKTKTTLQSGAGSIQDTRAVIGSQNEETVKNTETSKDPIKPKSPSKEKPPSLNDTIVLPTIEPHTTPPQTATTVKKRPHSPSASIPPAKKLKPYAPKPKLALKRPRTPVNLLSSTEEEEDDDDEEEDEEDEEDEEEEDDDDEEEDEEDEEDNDETPPPPKPTRTRTPRSPPTRPTTTTTPVRNSTTTPMSDRRITRAQTRLSGTLDMTVGRKVYWEGSVSEEEEGGCEKGKSKRGGKRKAGFNDEEEEGDGGATRGRRKKKKSRVGSEDEWAV